LLFFRCKITLIWPALICFLFDKLAGIDTNGMTIQLGVGS
jgi:hypothetical protein